MFTGFRYRRGLSQTAFARLAGVDATRVEEWEEYKRAPSVAELRDLAMAFEVAVVDLLVRKPGEPSLRHRSNAAWVGPEPVAWDEHAREQWGASPFAHWGYLRLQLGAGDGPRWHPVCAAQAWWWQNQLDRSPRRAKSPMVLGKTLDNRVLMFSPDRVFDASLLSATQSTSRPDFLLKWDADGLPPEMYRMLSAWARHDNIYGFTCSPAMRLRREALLDRPGMRRRTKIATLVDCTFIHRFSNAPIIVSADPANLQTAVRSVPLGMETVYLAERAGNTEWLVPIDDVQLLDMPALDLEEVRQFDVIVQTE